MTTQAPYARIVGEIRTRIAAGELRPGDRAPSTRQITREWGVAMATATKVIAALRQEGLVRPVPGLGTIVTSAASSTAARTARPETPTRPAPSPAARPGATERRPAGRAAATGISAEQVVRTAVALADRESLAGLSMRRIAAELRVPTMSLYRHVNSKDRLILEMVDAVFAEHPPPAPLPGWRARLEAIARLQWRIYHRHPWLAQVMVFNRPPLAPHAMAHTEWMMRALGGVGLPVTTVFVASVTLANYVRGTAVNLETEAQAEQETGLTDDQWMLTQEMALQRLLATGRFPAMVRAISSPGFEFDLDTLFEFGLGQLLDALAARIDS